MFRLLSAVCDLYEPVGLKRSVAAGIMVGIIVGDALTLKRLLDLVHKKLPQAIGSMSSDPKVCSPCLSTVSFGGNPNKQKQIGSIKFVQMYNILEKYLCLGCAQSINNTN